MKYFALNEMPWVYTEVSKRVIFACNVTKDPARVLVPLKTNIGDATICDRGAVTLRGVLLLTSKPASLTKLVFSLQSKINGAFWKKTNKRTNDKQTRPQPHPHPLLKFGYTLKSSTLLIQLDSRRLARSFHGYRTRIQIRLSVFALLDRNLDRCAQIWQTLAEDEVIIPHKTEAKESLTS